MRPRTKCGCYRAELECALGPALGPRSLPGAGGRGGRTPWFVSAPLTVNLSMHFNHNLSATDLNSD